MSRVRIITASPESCEWLLKALTAQNHVFEVAHPGDIPEGQVDFEIDAGLYPVTDACAIAADSLRLGHNVFASASAFPIEQAGPSVISSRNIPAENNASISTSSKSLLETETLVTPTDSFAATPAFVCTQPDAAQEILNTIAADTRPAPSPQISSSDIEANDAPELSEYVPARDCYLSDEALREITADVSRFVPEPVIQDEPQAVLMEESVIDSPEALEELVAEVPAKPAKPVPFVVARTKSLMSPSENPHFSEVCSGALKEAYGVSREGGGIMISKAKLSALEVSTWLSSLKRTLADRREEIEQHAVILRNEEPHRFTNAQLRKWRTVFAISAGLIVAVALTLTYVNRRPDAISSTFGGETERITPAPIVDARPTVKPAVAMPPIAVKPTGSARVVHRSDEFGPEVVVHRYPPKTSPIPATPHSGIKRFSDIASN